MLKLQSMKFRKSIKNSYKLIKSQANLQSVIECKNLKAKGNATNPNYKYNYNVHNTKGTKDTD